MGKIFIENAQKPPSVYNCSSNISYAGFFMHENFCEQLDVGDSVSYIDKKEICDLLDFLPELNDLIYDYLGSQVLITDMWGSHEVISSEHNY